MRGPGLPAGQVRYDPFTSIDFAPTIARIAGVAPRVLQDRKSMLGVARNGDRGWRRPILTDGRHDRTGVRRHPATDPAAAARRAGL